MTLKCLDENTCQFDGDNLLGTGWTQGNNSLIKLTCVHE